MHCVWTVTFGGAVLVKGNTGMLFSPMGMVTKEKAIQAMCCPNCLQVAFSYTDGAYSEGIQVDSRPGGCCKPAHWTISKKDYTTPAEGKDNAKLYPNKEVLASTVKVKIITLNGSLEAPTGPDAQITLP